MQLTEGSREHVRLSVVCEDYSALQFNIAASGGQQVNLGK